MTNEELKNKFLDDFEKSIENLNSPKGTFAFKKRNGTVINVYLLEAINLSKSRKIDEALGLLYPYYVKSWELPLTAWGYIYNVENSKQPIFWPNSMEYFYQFIKLLEELAYIGDFKKVEKEVNGKKRVETVCCKIMEVRPVLKMPDKPSK